MDFKIVAVYISDGQLVVRAEHFKPDGSAWFTEHYTWQGREGLKQKRATNALGQLLLDDGTVAPSTVVEGQVVYSVPTGRTWMLLPAPHMVNDSILSTIRSIHRQRLATGWPATFDRLPSFKANPADAQWCETLRLKFLGLAGHQE